MDSPVDVVKKKELKEILNSPPPDISIDDESSPPELEATLVVDTRCILGECVLYDDSLHTILWTDIDGKALYKLQLEDGALSMTKLPKMLGAFCLTNQRNVCLCGWQDGFQLFDFDKGKALSEYSVGPLVNPDGLPSRLNDGRCDPKGERFICGGFFGDDENVRVKVYSCRYDEANQKLIHEPIMENVRIANSLSFSPDGETMYFCDSPTKTIQQYEYKDGRVTFQKDIWSWQQEVGFPDGSCVDEEGYIWNAVWRKGAGPGRINRIDPSNGKVVFTVQMPDSTSQCTCVCFGGKDLDVLFITTASIDRDTSLEPHAGGLYAVKVPFRGRLESRFQLPPDVA